MRTPLEGAIYDFVIKMYKGSAYHVPQRRIYTARYYDSVYRRSKPTIYTIETAHTIFERDIGNEIQFSRKV